MHQYASAGISTHLDASVCTSMHQHASACVSTQQHAAVVYSLHRICIQSVLNLYKIGKEYVYNTQPVQNLYTVCIHSVYSLHEHQHKVCEDDVRERHRQHILCTSIRQHASACMHQYVSVCISMHHYAAACISMHQLASVFSYIVLDIRIHTLYTIV